MKSRAGCSGSYRHPSPRELRQGSPECSAHTPRNLRLYKKKRKEGGREQLREPALSHVENLPHGHHTCAPQGSRHWAPATQKDTAAFISRATCPRSPFLFQTTQQRETEERAGELNDRQRKKKVRPSHVYMQLKAKNYEKENIFLNFLLLPYIIL